MRRSGTAARCRSVCCAIAKVIGCPVTDDTAMRRVRAPSSSRTFDFVLVAMKIRTSCGRRHSFGFGLLVQDRHLGFEIRRLHIDHQTPFESGTKPLDQAGKLIRRRIARDHDLLLVVIQFVEGMEELFLGAFLAGNDVDVVNQQHVRRSVVPVETAACDPA